MRTLRPGDVLFGKTRSRVLGLLLGHPDESFYLREISRRTGSAPGAVQRDVDALTASEILTRTAEGRQVYFQANRESPLFPELQSLVIKTVGLVDVVRGALLSLGKNVELAFVFGSAARGELRASSDIDLFVVGRASFSDIANALVNAQRTLGRDVNPTGYSVSELRAKLRAKHHFVTSVLEGPRLFVIGNDDELERLGSQQMARQARDERTGDQRSPRRRRSRSR
jgi:predicted nucleotidyltransferase